MKTHVFEWGRCYTDIYMMSNTTRHLDMFSNAARYVCLSLYPIYFMQW